jgi:regulator of telomere elongation helicase 1
MWCLSAEVAITALSDAGARSIIFASGTLSPLESFAMEFGLGFKNRIENPHVINKDQLFIASVPHGPTNQVLNSSFQNRDSKTYMMELGRSILNICSNVPDGILIFFSGYKTLDDCINIWKVGNLNAV